MTGHAAPSASRPLAARLARPWLVGPLLFICILAGYLLSYNVDKPTHNADWYIRYQVACSIVERNAFYIRPYHNDQRTGPGLNGDKYSQYTLGQTTAMIPLYLLGRALGGVAHTNCDTTIAPMIVFLTVKMLDPILGALLCVLFFATARLLRYPPRAALMLTLLLAFGTALWPDVLSNLEHTEESLFLLVAAYAALRYTLAQRKSQLWALVMGLAAGLVFVTRVAGMIAIPIFALYLVILHRRLRPEGWRRPLARDLGIYALGMAPSILINALFDLLRFGSPFKTGPYPDQSFGYPPWLGIPNLLVSPGKGLFWYVPALFLLAFVARPFWRRFPLPTILFGLIAGIYVVFYGNVNYWHGDPAWGPRYLYAVLPYLILPLGLLPERWKDYRRPMRGLIVGVLAASFLVQLSAVSVSYWRFQYTLYGYHYDQVENHGWGQNLNYFWIPQQSPLVVSLTGLAEVTQNYVAHTPLLQHAADLRLSNPYETCIFQVYGQASLCVTDLEQLRHVANWNTFTMWWAHSFPWWSADTVKRLALVVLAIFLLSGGALLALLTLADRHGRESADGYREGHDTVTIAGSNGNGHGHGNGSGHVGPLDLAALPVLQPAHPSRATITVGPATLVAEAPAVPRVEVRLSEQGSRPITGLAPLGAAALLAGLIYLGIMDVAALNAPRVAAPLVRSVALNTAIHEGSWVYSATGMTSVTTLPGTLTAPVPGHHYVIVRLRLQNLLSRPHNMRPEYFDLTDVAGLAYPWMLGLNGPAAQLYHLTPFGVNVPAHSTVTSLLVFLVRDDARHLALLGPGIALTHLS